MRNTAKKNKHIRDNNNNNSSNNNNNNIFFCWWFLNVHFDPPFGVFFGSKNSEIFGESPPPPPPPRFDRSSVEKRHLVLRFFARLSHANEFHLQIFKTQHLCFRAESSFLNLVQTKLLSILASEKLSILRCWDCWGYWGSGEWDYLIILPVHLTLHTLA